MQQFYNKYNCNSSDKHERIILITEAALAKTVSVFGNRVK